MKRIEISIVLVLLSLFVLYQTGYTQTGNVTRVKWLQEMQDEEQRINIYINLHLKDPLPQEVLDNMKSAEQGEHISGKDRAGLIETMSRDYYRRKYFQLHPEATRIYNPGRVTDNTANASPKASSAPGNYTVSCNGNFEDGNLSTYAGYRSTYTAGDCSFVPPSSVAYAPASLTGSPDDFLLTSNVPDPLIPALNQTNGGSNHAMRINSFDPCIAGSGINMLQKTLPVTPISGRYRVNFSYALVLQDPGSSHLNQKPFFLARVLNSSGVEVGSRVCRSADITNPFYHTTPTPAGFCMSPEVLVWRDWTCAFIDFDAVVGQQYTIEFFAADCGQGAHFGYAYVDDICAGLCCPKFLIQDCCEYNGGGSTNPACCDPCRSPDDPFTVYVIDEFGNLVPTADYNISWSHDPGNTTPSTLLLPNQQTIVTVSNHDGSCVWTDTFQRVCCNDTIAIIQDSVSWDPCKYIQTNITLRVKNKTGTILTTGAGYTFLWEYAGGTGTSTADFLTLYPFYLPAYVTVTDPVTGCKYRDTFELHCCRATTPLHPGCRDIAGSREIYWDRVPNAAYYKVKLNINDTRCGCSEINPPGTIVLSVYDTTTTIPNTLAACYSWQVASVCPDSTTSAFSTPMCSCPPVCSAPVDLQCQIIFVPDPVDPVITIQRQLSWSAVPGAVGYEVEITYDEPGCCLVSSMITGTMATVSTTTYNTSAFGCFSWRVRAICSNGMRSPWSTRMCSCNWAIVSSNAGNSTGNTDADLENMFGPNDRNIKVTAAPNPASDYVDFNVQLDKGEYKNLLLSVIDLNGREVARKSVVNNTTIRVDVRDYKPGTYLYLIRDNNSVLYSSKILIQK